jgi:hypothetical protein
MHRGSEADFMRGTVYTSRAKVPFTQEELEELCNRAARENAAHDVTGYLYFGNGRFTQYIEGPQDEVDALVERIARDPRHAISRTFTTDDVPARRFPVWHMHVLSHSDLVELRLEHLLTGFLDTIAQMDDPGPRTMATAWKLVDSIARLQDKLVKLPSPGRRAAH